MDKVLKIGKIIAVAVVVCTKIKEAIAWCWDKWAKISPTIQPVIEEVEKAAADKQITREERKRIAMVSLANLEKSGAIKLNWFTRKLIGTIVNKVAEKLPDIDVSIQAPQLVADAIKQVKG